MRYFRSPELAFWTVVVLGLLALTLVAATRGSDPVPGGESTVPISAPGPSASQAREQVAAMIALMPAGIAAGTNVHGLGSYAAAVDAQAKAGAAVRSSEGADDDDAMLRGFQQTSSDAERLTAHVTDPVAATALRTQIGLDVDHLHRLVLDLPAPELPETGLDPFQSSTLTPVYPTAPATPAAPSLGGKQ